MDTDDEDADWLQACMEAVASLPAANLPTSAATGSTPQASGSIAKGPRTAPAPVGGCKVVSRRYAPSASPNIGHGVPTGMPQSCITNDSNNIYGGTHISSNGVRSSSGGWNTGGIPVRATNGVRATQGVQGAACRTSASGASPFVSGATPVQARHLGGNRTGPGCETRSQPNDARRIDPCWRCGEPVVVKDFGGGSGYPLCKATRKNPKNGPVIELVVEEAAASQGDEEGNAMAVTEERTDHAGIFRCHLAVRVHGGRQDGPEMRAVWDLLRRNGINPLTPMTPAAQHYGGSSGDVKAVLDLSKREFVRRLAKKENILYRDIPQTTYSRLASSGAGIAATLRISEGSPRKRAASAKTVRSLEPVEKCERLLHMLPPVLRKTLLPFQREGVMYGLRRRGRCLIADEMGTGKTLQALAVMACYKEDWPLLIVAPASMRLMWAEEVERWYPFLAPEDLHLIKGNKDKLYLADLDRVLWPRVTIVSYFMLRMLADTMSKDDWKAVIFDESHAISSKLGQEKAQSQQVTVCLKVAGRAKRVVLLSGTPSLSKPFDLYNQVEALSPGLLGRSSASTGKYDFASNYCQGAMRSQKSRGGSLVRVPYISGCEYADELHLLLKNEVMIRRLKVNVVDQLPPLRRIVVRVAEHTEHLKRALNAGGYDEGDVSEEAQAHGSRERAEEKSWRTGMHLMSVDQQAGLKKVRSASEWVVDKLIASEETKTKFVVFAHHKIVLDRLQESFELAGMRQNDHGANAADDGGGAAEDVEGYFTCLRIDGEVPTAIRAARLTEFNTDRNCRVLLVSITAGGQGLDFTAASNVVFVELPESPAWLRQAEDRLHRRRQEKSVNVYLTVLPPGSHDDIRWLSLSQKLTAQSSVVNGTAEAENIDVDQVFRAGGVEDGEEDGRRLSDFVSSRDVCGADLGNAADDDDSIKDDAGGASYMSDVESDGAIDGVDGPVRRRLDPEVTAMLLTPADVDTHSASPAATLKLLRALADSASEVERPKPIKDKRVAKRKANAKTVDHFFSSQESAVSASIQRKAKRRSRKQYDTRHHVSEHSQSHDKTAQESSVAPSPPKASPHTPRNVGSDEGTNVCPASRKRARCKVSSITIGTSCGSSTRSSWDEWQRATPPPPPRRRHSSSSSPSDQHLRAKSTVDVELSRGSGDVEGVGLEDNEERGDSLEDDDFVPSSLMGLKTRFGKVRARGFPAVDDSDNRESMTASSGVVVDLSAEDDPERDDMVNRVETKLHSGSEDHEIDFYADGDDTFDVDAASMHKASAGSTLHAESDRDLGGASDVGEGKCLSPVCPSQTQAGTLPQTWPLECSKGGGVNDEKDVEDRELASKLFFAVSCNTGRVHVYKKVDVGGDGSDGDDIDLWHGCDDGDGERPPRHCRCNFRPEDLDRLFAAANTWSDGEDAARCQALARDALDTLPDILRSAPALTMAKEFMKDWRALSSRKRPLLNGKPCRPPLAEVLHAITPKLTGSTQRYSDRVNGGAKVSKGPRRGSASAAAMAGSIASTGANESTDDRSRTDKVQCLFCLEPASVQGPAVHRRDRFCSATCMEAYGSRSSGSSLRRLVSERDAGVCAQEGCGTDCKALVTRLKSVQAQQKRRDILIATDARYDLESNRNLRERLVRKPNEGSAWHADHVTAVFEGGGECGVDNLRTLCVVCHAEVTRTQAQERATKRAITRLKEAATMPIPGQRRLISFGGGLTLSQGTETPSREAGGAHDTVDLAAGETDSHSEDDDRDDIDLVESEAQRVAVMGGVGLDDDVGITLASDGVGVAGAKGRTDEAETTARPRGAMSRRTSSEVLRASREQFEQLINDTSLFSPDRCSAHSPNATSRATKSTDYSRFGKGDGGVTGVSLADGDSDSDGIIFTRVSRPKKRRGELSRVR